MGKHEASAVEAKDYIEGLVRCCLEGMPKNYRVIQCPYLICSENDGPSGFVVCEIEYDAGTRWAVVIDSQDYTGHG